MGIRLLWLEFWHWFKKLFKKEHKNVKLEFKRDLKESFFTDQKENIRLGHLYVFQKD